MKWIKELEPKDYQVRFGTKFALFPTRMSDGITVVWLEKYDYKETFYHGDYFCPGMWLTTETTVRK